MGSKDKYYTPAVEEFHTGFDYEVFQKGQSRGDDIFTFMPTQEEDEWFKYKYPDPFLGYQLDRLLKKDIRVKYLDREDIESLGYKHIGSGWYEKGTIRIRKWKDQQLDVHELFSGEWDRILRANEVKNKSELKRILKQIGVIE